MQVRNSLKLDDCDALMDFVNMHVNLLTVIISETLTLTPLTWKTEITNQRLTLTDLIKPIREKLKLLPWL